MKLPVPTWPIPRDTIRKSSRLCPPELHPVCMTWPDLDGLPSTSSPVGSSRVTPYRTHLTYTLWHNPDIKPPVPIWPTPYSNCFRKGGFRTPDGATTQGDVVVEPPAGIDAEHFERFVEVDHDLDCIGNPTDEDICSDVREARSDINVNDAPEEDTPPPTPTTAQIQQALDMLRNWMQVHGENAEYSHLCAMEGMIHSMFMNQRKQMTITNFFRPESQL